MTISIPQPTLTPEQLQAAMLDRRIILLKTDQERVEGMRRYWEMVLEAVAIAAPFPADFSTLTGAFAMEKTQMKNDVENCELYIKNRKLAASLAACAGAIAAERKRHGHVMQQKLAPDQHNNEFTLHSNAMIRLRDNHEASQLAYQACSKFEQDLSHLLNVSAFINELASNDPEAAMQGLL